MTALTNMAAAARPPGIGDARVPCPLCGGLIHPVAGRCKHCKQDLTTLRAGRPQAATALPSLAGVPAAAAAVAAPAPVVAREASAPILPQRTTGRTMAAQRPRGSLLRNWPLIVIVLAMLAIVAAVVIMVLPQNTASAGGKRQLMPTPAPDRMDTMPGTGRQSSNLPPGSSGGDPWADPGDPNPNAVPRNAPVPPPPDVVVPDPDDVDPDDDDLVAPADPNDLYGSLGGATNTQFMLTMIQHACDKLKSCPNAAGGSVDIACTAFGTMQAQNAPSQCPPAQRCLRAIDRIDCDAATQGVDPLSTVMTLQDCMTAMRDC